MAHQTQQTIDEAAAAAAAATAAEITREETTAATEDFSDQPVLAYGATGDDVARLVHLLAAAGFATNTVLRGAPPIMDESVLHDLRAFLTAQELEIPDQLAAAEIPSVVVGELVGPAVWNRLYTVVGEKLSEKGAATTGDTAGGA